MNNADKYYWVINHPMLTSKYLPQARIEMTPQMVNPLNDTIEKDDEVNTKQQWWVEVVSTNLQCDIDGESPENITSEHDWELDTGGDTAEEVIDKLYEIVLAKHGKY